jgi:hypothetical protein
MGLAESLADNFVESDLKFMQSSFAFVGEPGNNGG